MTAHDELRARLDDYRQAVATYESPDPHDREEARYAAVHAARARLGAVKQVEALLAEYDALREENARLRAKVGQCLALRRLGAVKQVEALLAEYDALREENARLRAKADR